MKALVSIVIPVFNGLNYMRAAIDSALAQTWPYTEVIIVNDGSKDGGATHKIAMSYGDRIRYVDKPNGGVASALNAGIAAMRGEVFCWLSHDDRHLPHKIERQMAEWERQGRPDKIFISDYRLIDERGKTITNVALNHDLLAAKPQYALLRGSIHGCSVFVPKKIFDTVGVFDEGRPTTQDYHLWHRTIRAGFTFEHMPEVLIESRWHDEQGSKKIDHVVEATDFWLRAVDEIPIGEREGLEGTNYRFLTQMAEFLGANKLEAAASQMRDKAERSLAHILVSVVIPIFNRFHLLAGAISSVAKQSHKNLEIILVDDGSTEDQATLNAIIENATVCIRLIRQNNAGPAAARNVGWQAARGKYVAFLDADDLFLPSKIETQLRFMEKNNLVFTHTSYFRHWERTKIIDRIGSGSGNTFPDIIGGCGIATPTVMLLASIRDQFRFPDNVRIGEDNILWMRIASTNGVVGLDEPLTTVRASKDSTAYDRTKLKQGVSNVLQAIRHCPSLAAHKSEVALLENFFQSIDRS